MVQTKQQLELEVEEKQKELQRLTCAYTEPRVKKTKFRIAFPAPIAKHVH
jgi:hypothetical protein